MTKEKRWIYKNKTIPPEKVMELAEAMSLPRVISSLLLNRGISEKEQVKSFLSKSMRAIRHPSGLPDMDKAVSRLRKAIDGGEKIMVYGDYDVDGMTSGAMVYSFLKSLGADVSYYIPERASEGYGLNIVAVNKFIKQGVKLVVTVDCGITAVGEADFASLSGLDMIITDHHTCKDALPKAAAVVNPKREDSEYGFDALAGVGVAFKLIMALGLDYGQSAAQIFDKYVELAAIGTISDIMPLVDENRVIVDRGLKMLEHSRYAGLRALLEVSGAKPPYNAATIGFALAPRMNAAGRLGNAAQAVELLLSEDDDEAYRIARSLDDENRLRQETEAAVAEQAVKMIESDPEFNKKRIIVLAKEGWHSGVIGIVASRIQKLYYKPCILFSCENGIGKGSGRSIESFNLFDALSECSDFLIEFGGHKLAAGMSANTENIPEFDFAINEYAKKVMKDEDLIPRIEIDCPLLPRQITIGNVKLLSALEPFGESNPKPVFSLSDMRIDYITTMGMDNKHLRLTLINGTRRINAVGFSMGSMAEEFSAGDIVEVAFCMDINTYRSEESVQLVLKDMKKGGNRDGQQLC
jgi:single-stranded-DNA-specific exonuclease